MARIDTLANFLTDVSAAIKAKTGKTDPITPANFDTEINSIQGSSSETFIPTSLKDLIDKYDIFLKTISKSLSDTTNINEPYTTEPIILYSPSDANKHYFIRNNGSGYQFVWCEGTSIQNYNNIGIMPSQVDTKSGVKIETDGYVSSGSIMDVSPSTMGTLYRTSNAYATIEECIAAVKDPTTAYVSVSTSNYWNHTLITDTSITPYSNMVCFGLNDEIIPSAKISSNETIEVIPTTE